MLCLISNSIDGPLQWDERGGRTDVFVCQVPPRLVLRFDYVQRPLDEILQKLLGGDSNGKGCIVRAGGQIVVGVNDLLDASHYDVSVVLIWRALQGLRTGERYGAGDLVVWGNRGIVVRHLSMTLGLYFRELCVYL